MLKEKILLAAPNSVHKNYCFKEWLILAKSFGCDIFIADNSPLDANKDLYESLKVPYEWINPHGKSSEQFICESQNKIREKVLKEGYTHLFFLETDLFPPTQILPLFLAMDVPVVSAPYFIYKNSFTTPMNQEIRIFDGEAITRNYTLGESFSFMDGGLKKCYATGFGCTLVKRQVLQQVDFRYTQDQYVQDNHIGPSHADSYFYADLQKVRIQAYLYTGITVRHYNSDWNKIREFQNN